MSDLVIGEGSALEEFGEEDATSNEYINMCMTVIDTLSTVDEKIQDPPYEKMIVDMRKYSIRIAHFYLKRIHKDLYGDKKTGKLGPND